MAFGVRTDCLSSFPPSKAQKWKNFNFFFDILTIHNDKISYVKRVLDPVYMFFTPFGFFCGGGGGVGVPRGHNLLMQFFSPCSSKMEISETDFLYILTIHNDQISYVKHVLDPIHVLFHPIWVFGRGQGARAQPACATFHSRQLKNVNFQNGFF